MKNNFGRRRGLGFETLEGRQLLAGNITAGLDVNGNLVITGDTQDNHVAVYRGFFGQILVEGGNSNGQLNGRTTVNGQFGSLGFNTTGGIIINTGAGNDLVILTNLAVQGNVTGTLGDGSDRLGFQTNASGGLAFTTNSGGSIPFGKYGMSGLVQLNGGSGNDLLLLNDATIGGNLEFVGGAGNDTFNQFGNDHSQNAVGGNVNLQGQGGNDIVGVRRLAVGGEFRVTDGSATVGSDVSLINIRVNQDLRISLSTGDDNVLIAGEDTGSNRFQAANVVVVTGVGEDDVNINRGIMLSMNVDTGDGNEGGSTLLGVQLHNLTVNGITRIATGAGIDNVLVNAVNTGSLRVLGGTERDIVTVQSTSAVDSFMNLLDGNDDVFLQSSSFQILRIVLEDDNDRASAQNVTVTERFILDGGLGLNTYTDQGGNSFARFRRINI